MFWKIIVILFVLGVLLSRPCDTEAEEPEIDPCLEEEISKHPWDYIR